jgi:hypothetical protein
VVDLLFLEYLDPSVYQQLFGFNPQNYYGREVTQIDGTNVVSWFKVTLQTIVDLGINSGSRTTLTPMLVTTKTTPFDSTLPLKSPVNTLLSLVCRVTD